MTLKITALVSLLVLFTAVIVGNVNSSRFYTRLVDNELSLLNQGVYSAGIRLQAAIDGLNSDTLFLSATGTKRGDAKSNSRISL